jgi:predicted transcriptional regulator of viral defense system
MGSRLTKDGWFTKTERGRYRVVDVVPGGASPQSGRAQ